MAERAAVVIGAGVAGLATAALLGREGYDVTVIERLDSAGGRAGEETVEGFRFDTGPSWYLMPDAFEHFFGLFGTRPEDYFDLVELSPAYRLFPEGLAAVDVASGRENATALFESLEPGAGAALGRYLDSAREVYDMAVERFLYTTFGALGPYVDKRMRARYGELLRLLAMPLDSFVNRRFSDRRLRQMLTYPAVFLSSNPARTPALYHLMSHTDLTQGVKYPQGGFAAVVRALQALAEDNGARILFNSEVASIEKAGSRASGVTLSDATFLPADLVVSAADLRHTETQLLGKASRTYRPRWFERRDPGVGAVLLMLGVRGPVAQLAHHNLLFSGQWEDDFAAVFDAPGGASRSLYVSKPSATDPSTAPVGCENLFVLVPTSADTTIGHGNLYHDVASPRVDAIADAALDQIADWCNVPDLRERVVVRRTLGPADFAERYNAWSGGAVGPAHTLRQSAFLRGSNRSRKLRNLYYAGATTVPGVGVPMCLISAENVIKRLRDDRSPGPLTS